MKYIFLVILSFLLLPIYVAYGCYIMDLLSDKLEHRRQQKKYKRLKVSDVFSFNRELNEVMKEIEEKYKKGKIKKL